MTITLNVTVAGSSGSGTGTWATAITSTRGSGFAPFGAVFTTDASDADKRRLHFTWAYDDAGIFQKLSSVRRQGRDRDTSRGPTGNHVWDTVGTKTITCRIEDGTGTFQVLTTTVTVADQGATFPTTDTICVSTNSDWTGAPAGAQLVTSFVSALAAMKSNGGGRILLKRGQTNTMNSGRNSMNGPDIAGLTAVNTVMIGAYGSGARPIIAPTDGYLSWDKHQNAATQFSLHGVHIKGDYDVITGLGWKQHGITFSNEVLAGTMVVHDCEISKCGQSVSNILPTGSNGTVIISDTFIHSWEDYASWTTAGRVGFSGLALKQDLSVVCGSEAKQDQTSPNVVNHADHGPIRISEAPLVSIVKSDLRTLNGWSSPAGYAHQPCIRGNTDQKADVEYTISDNYCEGGGTGIISLEPHAGQTVYLAAAIVVEANYLVGSHATYQAFEISQTNSIFRTNIIVIPDVKSSMGEPTMGNSVELSRFFDLQDNNPQGPANRGGEMLIQSNTFIDLRSVSNATSDVSIYRPQDLSDTGWTNFAEQGNVFHAPNRGTPVTSDGPINMTTFDTPTIQGVRHADFAGGALQAGVYAAGSGTIVEADLLTGAGGIGSETPANTSIADFNGTLRNVVVGPLARTNYCKGAIESPLEN
jgi:hypothetical protein